MTSISYTSQQAKCGCAPNPCCCPPPCPSGPRDIITTTTTVNRSSVINMHGDCHRRPYHGGYVEHSHCHSSSTNGTTCQPKCGPTAKCVDPTLICATTEVIDDVVIHKAKVNAGISGIVLASFNGQYYVLPSGAEVTVETSADTTAQTCGPNVLMVNGAAVTPAMLYNEDVNIAGCEHCCQFSFEESHTGDLSVFKCKIEVGFINIV